MELNYFDCHSHVSFKDYDLDRDAVLLRMAEQGVGTITVGVDLETSIGAVSFAEKHTDFYATIGLHPNDTPTETFDEHLYEAIVTHPKVVGIGECGVDYYRIGGDIQTEKTRQWVEFNKQLWFAINHDKPVMIHCRPSKGSMDAYEDMLIHLERTVRQTPKARGNIHFFVGNVDIARRFYDIGFTTSFTGVITFAREYDEVIKFAPLDMLLTETDAPYAAPVPYRGSRNEPVYVKEVVAAISRIRGTDEETVRTQVVANAQRLFRF